MDSSNKIQKKIARYHAAEASVAGTSPTLYKIQKKIASRIYFDKWTAETIYK